VPWLRMSRFESVTCDKVAFPGEFNDSAKNVTFSKRDKWVQSVTKVVGRVTSLQSCSVTAGWAVSAADDIW
jgi:hypothetical protein